MCRVAFGSPSATNRRTRMEEVLVGEIGGKPFFGFFDRHLLAVGVALELVALDLADIEVAGFFVEEVETTDR